MKTSEVHLQVKNEFIEKRWDMIKMGELIKVYKDEEFPADIILLKSSKENGMAYVDTMNLDGETNLKERSSPKEF
jgi:phospholipid-translocating ATPase